MFLSLKGPKCKKKKCILEENTAILLKKKQKKLSYSLIIYLWIQLSFTRFLKIETLKMENIYTLHFKAKQEKKNFKGP